MRKITVKCVDIKNNNVTDLISAGCTILKSSDSDRSKTGGRHLSEMIVVSFERKNNINHKGLRNFTMTREKLQKLENGSHISFSDDTEEGFLIKVTSLDEHEKTTVKNI